MNPCESTAQLNMIETWWPEVREAHADTGDMALPARHNLLNRYFRAAKRYLLGAVRDEDAAGDLFQEFALRLLRGDFRRANPERGRFRDYVRSVLINLVNKYSRSRQRDNRALTGDNLSTVPDADPAAELLALKKSLREKMLIQTWVALHKVQPRYHTVLQLRVEAPDLSSAELAEKLTATTGECWKADQFRKTLERARSTFVELLIEKVSSFLHCCESDDVWEALAELGLLEYCRVGLERRAAVG